MIVVSNTSPLLFLSKIDRLDLLSTLYDRIFIPEAVVDEIEAKSTPDTKRIRNWRKQAAVDVRGATAAVQDRLPGYRCRRTGCSCSWARPRSGPRPS